MQCNSRAALRYDRKSFAAQISESAILIYSRAARSITRVLVAQGPQLELRLPSKRTRTAEVIRLIVDSNKSANLFDRMIRRD
jgi:hypothetical protein